MTWRNNHENGWRLIADGEEMANIAETANVEILKAGLAPANVEISANKQLAVAGGNAWLGGKHLQLKPSSGYNISSSGILAKKNNRKQLNAKSETSSVGSAWRRSKASR